MNKKEKELLNIFENSIDSNGDFRKIENKIVIELNTYKKRKNLLFFLPLSIGFACSIVLCIIIPSLINNGLSKNTNGDAFANDSKMEMEAISSDFINDETNEPQQGVEDSSQINTIKYNDNYYQLVSIIDNDSQEIGNFIEMIEDIEVYYYNQDDTFKYIVIKQNNKYYLMEKVTE